MPPTAYEGPERATRTGWVSGPWVAIDTVSAREQRNAGAPIAFRLVPGDRVDVDTGVTVTTRAGQVRFNRAASLGKSQPPLQVSAGDTVHVLAYLGEGFATVWFKGRIVRDADLNGICGPGTSGCRGEELSSPETEWWLRIRTASGRTGWTRDEAKFRRNAWRQRS